MTTESVPTSTLTKESVPGRGASQDGAYTEVDQDGAWTEYDLDGAYTADNAYIKEARPLSIFTKEAVPA